MPQVFDTNGNLPNIDEISCGVFVNRGQPLLKTHLGCIKQIAGNNQEREVLILIGSTNSNDEFFSPLDNPLTADQRKRQMDLALNDLNIKYKIDYLPDLGNSDKWIESIASFIKKNGFFVKKTAFCYFKKENECQKSSSKLGITPLDAYSQKIQNYGISLWRLRNSDLRLDNVSATPFRTIDLFSPSEEIKQKIANTLVVPDFIKSLVIQARQENLSSVLLNELKIPKTMLDLSLIRLQKEAKIHTKFLLDNIDLDQEPQFLFSDILKHQLWIR